MRRRHRQQDWRATGHGHEYAHRHVDAQLRWDRTAGVPHQRAHTQGVDEDALADGHRHAGADRAVRAVRAATTTTTTDRRATAAGSAARHRQRARRRPLGEHSGMVAGRGRCGFRLAWRSLRSPGQASVGNPGQRGAASSLLSLPFAVKDGYRPRFGAAGSAMASPVRPDPRRQGRATRESDSAETGCSGTVGFE